MEDFSKSYISRKHLHIHLTDLCNLNCVHCYLGDKTGQKSYSYHDVINILNYGYLNNIRDVTFGGGEPFIYKNLKDLIIEARKIGFEEVRIQTNATIQNVDIKIFNLIDYLCVSLDGPDAVTNDKIRGTGSFNKVIQFIDKALKEKCFIKVNCVVNNLNKYKLFDMIEFVNTLKVKELHFQVMINIGNVLNDDTLSLKPEEWISLRNSIAELNSKYTRECTIFYQMRYVTQMELREIINKGYNCSIINETGYWFFPDGKVYHCLCLSNTVFYSKIYNFETGQIENNNEFNISKAGNFVGEFCDLGLNKNIDKKIVSICAVWKNYIGKAPY